MIESMRVGGGKTSLVPRQGMQIPGAQVRELNIPNPGARGEALVMEYTAEVPGFPTNAASATRPRPPAGRAV